MRATLNDVVELLAPACREAGYPPVTAQELLDYLAEEDAERAAQINRRLRERGTGREQALLRDEHGKVYGQVLMELDAAEMHQIEGMPGWGEKAFTTPEGRKEVLKAFPEFGVKTLKPARSSGVTFGRGTMEFAK